MVETSSIDYPSHPASSLVVSTLVEADNICPVPRNTRPRVDPSTSAAGTSDLPSTCGLSVEEQMVNLVLSRCSADEEAVGAPDEVPLRVGQRLPICPNQACISAPRFDCDLVVDSRVEGRDDEVVDVWPRWRRSDGTVGVVDPTL
ncbi:hypothetical protein VTK73DRAFT_5447 [Phialemonium thermophilum]|uniref:Uncharacterized protein n=1 Tax=Phialemonium thermophilum TaxID=223376 RepID=A0ABR3V266_9PEZI